MKPNEKAMMKKLFDLDMRIAKQERINNNLREINKKQKLFIEIQEEQIKRLEKELKEKCG